MIELKLIKSSPIGTIVDIDPETGMTTNNYELAADLDVRELADISIVIGNTGSTYSLDYQVLVYSAMASLGGIGHEETSNAIVHDDSDSILLKRHAQVQVYVRSTASGDHTNWRVEAIGGR